MSSLSKESLINAFVQLGQFMAQPDQDFEAIIHSASRHNAWFTVQEIEKALSSLSHMLNKNDLQAWMEPVQLSRAPKKIGLILAGNIPLVGFHDVLCVLATGHIAMIKMSSSDDKLLPALLKKLVEFEPSLHSHITYTEQLKDFDAIIATGSNNSSRYFEFYFGKVPNIIRKNRNSVAILSGQETEAELESLGHDIFDYFGLGCRNVSKIYVPEDYKMDRFFESIAPYADIINHFKYNNNYDYNKSVYLVNMVKHLDNGFLLVKEDEALTSPLAVLFYETYTDAQQLATKLNAQQDQIQCVVSQLELPLNNTPIAFGQSQNPKLWDYADNINTLDFLQAL